MKDIDCKYCWLYTMGLYETIMVEYYDKPNFYKDFDRDTILGYIKQYKTWDQL